MNPFQIQIVPDDKQRARLYLLQLPVRTEVVPAAEGFRQVGVLADPVLTRVWPSIQALVGDAGLPAVDGKPPVSGHVGLSEEAGSRLGLAFHLIEGLRQEKAEAVFQGLTTLPSALVGLALTALSGTDEAEKVRMTSAVMAYVRA